MATASGNSPPAEELRLVLLGKVGAGKSKVARLLLGRKEPKGEIGSCIIHEGEAAGRKITLVDTPGWNRNNIHHTSEKIKNEIVRSATLCPPGPHALILVLRVESTDDVPSVKELKTVSRHMELLSQRVWKHTMVLFLCDEEVENNPINQHVEKANRLLEKCGNRHYILRTEEQIPELLEEIEKMVEENCGDFFLPQIYYDYMQSNSSQYVAEVKKMYEEREAEMKQRHQRKITECKTQAEEREEELRIQHQRKITECKTQAEEREEELRIQHQRKITECKTQAEEAPLRQRCGSISGTPPNLSEADQTADTQATKSQYPDEMLALAQYYLKPVALIALVFVGALIGSVVGSTHGVLGSGVGIIIGFVVTVPLALWLMNALSVARDTSKILQEEHSTHREQTVPKRD